METNTVEMRQEDLEKATGGTFVPNRYTESEYASAGIKCVTHLIEKDEFWWRGENIGEQNANTIMYYTQHKGYAPDSLQEAVSYKKRSQTRT